MQSEKPINLSILNKAPDRFRTLITLLLEKDPSKRLGAKGTFEIKEHEFFKGLDWNKVSKKLEVPKLQPNKLKLDDTSMFDP